MLKSRLLKTALIAVPALFATSGAIAAPIAYSLSDDGSVLVAFDVGNPAGFSTVSLNGAATAIDAIDFRPLGGTLYGYSDATDSFYTVDAATGTLTLASAGGMNTPTDTGVLDIDFNPTIDRLRIVTGTDQNIVYNPNTGTASDGSTTPLFYNGGDANDGVDPTIAANGYTNSEFGNATTTGTTQYVVDIELDILATLANNAGTLDTIGDLGIEVGEDIGLDIFFENGTDTAYLLVGSGDDEGLYTVDLATADVTLLVDFSDASFFQGDLTSLAVGPAAVAVSEPAAAATLGFGLMALGFAARRRRNA